ncbi:MAG: hypothetical protein HQ556_03175 [Candidatus Marinimicrobia bacterium]|nr:hypothetical protein [Candidatus Neomarinimicrobiota bacterium]
MQHSDKCPICSSPATIWEDSSDIVQCKCIRCGNFDFEHHLNVDGQYLGGDLSERQLSVLSSQIYHNPKTLLDDKKIEYLIRVPTPSVGTRADALLYELSLRHPEIGGRITNIIPHLTSVLGDIEAGSTATDLFKKGRAQSLLRLLPVTWSANIQEFAYLFSEYLEKNLKAIEHVSGQAYRITPKGWAIVHELESNSINSKQGFVAMDFTEELKPIFFNGIRPGIEGAGYGAKILHDHPHNNWIADEIMTQIRRSRFMVADVSTHNQGVYFEAGFALGLGIPVIWICTKDEFKKRHFDTAQINTIKYTEDNLSGLIKELKHRIENTITKK